MTKRVENVLTTLILSPNAWRSMSRQTAEKLAKDIQSLIERHVEPHIKEEYFVSAIEIDVEHEEEAYCRHCGAEWRSSRFVNGTVYNGGCCDQDEDNNPSLLSVEQMFDRWAAETTMLSSTDAIMENPWREIISSRKEEALSYAIERCREHVKGGREVPTMGVFPLLHRLSPPSFKNPVKPASRGVALEMARDWVEAWDAHTA